MLIKTPKGDYVFYKETDSIVIKKKNIEKSPENLIITVKRSVYKAFRAFKYLNSDLLK